MKQCSIALLSLSLSLFIPRPLYAQICNDGIAATAPDSRYQIHHDGTATDHQTGLMWKRCAEGQSWNNQTCNGNETPYSWTNALEQPEIANRRNDLGYNDWRLPTKKELITLIEERCYGPAINLTVFPGTQSTVYWTSSPLADFSANAWGVSFNFGAVYGNHENDAHIIRLVRPAHPRRE